MLLTAFLASAVEAVEMVPRAGWLVPLTAVVMTGASLHSRS